MLRNYSRQKYHLSPSSPITKHSTPKMSTLNMPPYRDLEDFDKYDTKPFPPGYLYSLDDDSHSEQMKDHLQGIVYGNTPPAEAAEDFDSINTSIAERKHAEWT